MPSLSVTYDPATNRQTGESADANGNICSGGNWPCTTNYTYDVENRITYFSSNQSSSTAAYAYAPGNKRVWRGVWTYDPNTYTYTQTADELTFWGVNGQKLTTYSLQLYYGQFIATPAGSNYYFGGKLIKNATGYVGADRLGSIGKYFPYGQERPSATTDGKEKFATYFRDSETGLDYANNRYHQPGMGRFMTPDPYAASGGPSDPGSWNRYSYVQGDPVNFGDPKGLIRCAHCEDDPEPEPPEVDWSFLKSCAEGREDPLCNQGGSGIPTESEEPEFLAFGDPFAEYETREGIQLSSIVGVRSVNRTVGNLLDTLRGSDCAKWLGGNPTWGGVDRALDQIDRLRGSIVTATMSKSVLGISYSAGVEAMANATIYYKNGVAMMTNAIILNQSGAYFLNTGTWSGSRYGITAGSSQAQALILLHELAHALDAPFFSHQDGSSADYNNGLLMEHCGSLISSFGK